MTFREDMVEQVRPFVRYVSISLTILSILLGILCFKWRSIADCFIYIYTILFLMTTTIPSNNEIINDQIISITAFIIFVLFSTNRVSQVIFVAIIQIILYFLVMSVIYEQQMTLGLIFLKVISSLTTIFCNAGFLAIF